MFCTAPFLTSFSANGSSGSPLSSNLSYNWTFGNSTAPSTQANPPGVSYGQGQFVVSLTGTDDNNCSTTVTTQVSVTQPSLLATIPPTVCINALFFVTLQATQLTSLWSMGDGSTETFTIPSVTAPFTNTIYAYTTPGPMTIFVTIGGSGCSATQTLTTFVEQIIPSFTSTPPSISCGPSVTASYINQSSTNTGAALTYSWASMVPGTVGGADDHATYTFTTGVNSTFVFYQNSLNPYTAYSNFIPAISLTVVSLSAAHCTANVVQLLDTIIRPTAFFNKDKKEGCAPLVVTFRDTSFTHLPNYPITSYTWNSGTSPATVVPGVLIPPATITPVSFTYNSPGTYTPYLIIQTAGGCVDTSFVDTITVVAPPIVSASFQTLVCAGQAIPIHLTASPTSTAIEHWHVDTDAGYFSGCITDPDPSFIFTHIGTHTVGVTAYQNGCSGTTVMPQQITVKGPFGRFNYATDCSTPTVVSFLSVLQEVQTATLNYGDGHQDVVLSNPNAIVSNTLAHTYTPSLSGGNNYTVTLTCSNPLNAPCVTNTYTMEIKVRIPQAVMYVNNSPTFPVLPAPLVCTNQTVLFDASHSIDSSPNCQRGYQWFLTSPNPVTNQPPVDYQLPVNTLAFQAPGVYTLTLRIRDDNDCVSSVSRSFRVSSAPPAFHFSVNPICLSDNPVKIINTTATTTLNPDPYVNFTWNFGDNSPSMTTTLVTDIPSHSYLNVPPPSTVYFVTGTATNTFGCTNSSVLTVTVSNPAAFFYSDPLFACVPEHVNFYCLSPTPLYTSYSLLYSDSLAGPAVTTYSNFIHNYTTSGVHSITLTVTDFAGCKNSSVRSFTAYVTPVASFTTLGNTGFCHGSATYTLSSTSTTTDQVNSPITTYIWDLGTGPFATNLPTAVNFFTAGITPVSLTVAPASSPYLICPATVSANIHVYNTQANLLLNKYKFCIGDTITGHLTGLVDATGWILNVGFGIEPSTTAVSPFQSLSYSYTNSTQTGTAVVVTAEIDSPIPGCSISSDTTVEIINLNPDFKRNLELSVIDSVHCLKVQDAFTHGLNDTTDPLVYNWDFGNGSTTTAPDPVYTYTAAGVFPVHLIVRDNQVGCVASSVRNMTINPLPTATVFAGNNCPDKPFVVNGAASPGVISGTWSPVGNIAGAPIFTTTTSSFSASANASIATVFSLSVTDISGCVSEVASSTLSVQKVAQPINRDTSIVIGQTVSVNMFEEGGFTYSWTPVITDLSCNTCYNPTSTTTVDITYSVQVADTLGCKEVTSTYKIIIEPKTSADVPSAFTPNGDGTNDIVYVGGWGIKRLNYFRIFNRWGQLLFESNDIKVGWDGNFNGIPQNMETYVYQMSVETYLDEKPILKTGTVKIIR